MWRLFFSSNTAIKQFIKIVFMGASHIVNTWIQGEKLPLLTSHFLNSRSNWKVFKGPPWALSSTILPCESVTVYYLIARVLVNRVLMSECQQEAFNDRNYTRLTRKVFQKFDCSNGLYLSVALLPSLSSVGRSVPISYIIGLEFRQMKTICCT